MLETKGRVEVDFLNFYVKKCLGGSREKSFSCRFGPSNNER